MKMLVGVFMGLLIGAVVWGRTAPTPNSKETVLRVQRLEIGPKQGKPLIVLSVTPQGAGDFSMWDPAGNRKVAMRASKSTTVFWMMDEEGKPTVSLETGDKIGSIMVRGADGKQRYIPYYVP